MSRRRRYRRSRVAVGVAAVRRVRRRYTRRAKVVPSWRVSTELAVRDAAPRTLGGLAAQGAALGGLAAARSRGRWAPVAAVAGVVPAQAWWPGPASAGLVVAGTAGWAVHRVRAVPGQGWAGPGLGVAAGASGALVYTAASHVGMLGGLPWWQHLLVVGTAAAPGAAAWWRPVPVPDPGPGPAAELVGLPAEMQVLRKAVTEAIGIKGSPIAGARLVSLGHQAEGVATAILALPGTHTRSVSLPVLRDDLEALAAKAAAAHAGLGELALGAVQVVPTGVSRLQVTASWSTQLADQALAYAPPAGLDEGAVWLGKATDRTDVVIPGWTRGPDGRVSCHHAKVVGATGSGKSVTLRDLMIGGLRAGVELVIPLDGKGDSLDELAALVPGGRIARDADSWQAGIELFAAIFLSRKRRQGTPASWVEPRPDDPMITLLVDEAGVLRDGLAPEHHAIVGMGARQTRSLGMRTIQASQVPLVDEWIGGGAWRAQASITLLHTLRDETHARIAAQGLDTDLDLTLLPRHFAAAAIDAHVISARTRVPLITEADVRAITARTALHPIDQALAGPAWDAYTAAVTIGAPGAGDTDPLAEALRALGTPGIATTTPGTTTTTTITTSAPAAASTGLPTQTEGNANDQHPAAGTAGGSIREQVLTRLMTTTTWPTRPDLVRDIVAAGWSRSGVHKVIGQMLADGALIEEAGRLAPAILAGL